MAYIQGDIYFKIHRPGQNLERARTQFKLCLLYTPAGGDSYSYTWFEQAWIPSGAEHQDAAKLFISYLRCV